MKILYRPTIAACLLIGGIPSLLLWAAVWGSSGARTDWTGITIATAVSVVLFACLVRYQIVITPDEVTFRSPFRKRSIRRDQIKKVSLLWLNLFQRRYSDVLKAPLRLVIEPRESSGAQRMEIHEKQTCE